MRSALRFALACALFGAIALGATACGVELEHGLDERQANQIAALLEGRGIAADKARDEGAEGWKIVVPRGELGRAFELLSAHDLPRRERKGLTETLADRSLLPSLAEEHARLESARAVELERTLEEVPGILSARVHLALPDPARLDGATHPRAAILLHTSGATALTEAGARSLVAGAIAGLAERDVAVVFAQAPPADPQNPTEAVGPLRVARGERGRVVAIAASGLALVVLLGAALLLTGLRRLRERGVDEPQVAPSKRSG